MGKDEHKITLEIVTALTPEVAEAFGCRELIYAGNVPRSGVEEMNLEGGEVDCDVHLKHDAFAFGTVVEKIGKYKALMEGTGPLLQFEVKFNGYVITVADLIEHVRVDPLEVTLKPAQIPIDLQEEKKPEAEDGQRLISEDQAADTAAEDVGAPLAPAAVMGGTHQRGRPRKNEPTPEADFMSDVEVPETVQ